MAMRILIAEDEQRARRGLKELLCAISDQYNVVAEASDGKKALELIQIMKPDLVFTDIRMPCMDGIALIKAATAAEIHAKYVIISAYEEFETARQAISLGVREYLVKPVIYDEVKELMERMSREKGKGISGEVSVKLTEKYANVHPLIKKTLKFIENGYASKISQKELADNFGISQEYFSYLFNKEMGVTFSKFLRDYRIEAAKALLLSGEIAKEEIPYSVGFSDPKYFNKVFRKELGMNITEYLRKNSGR